MKDFTVYQLAPPVYAKKARALDRILQAYDEGGTDVDILERITAVLDDADL